MAPQKTTRAEADDLGVWEPLGVVLQRVLSRLEARHG
jgi:hypothetical protein